MFLIIGQVADIVQVSERTVRRWINGGDLPVHRIGRSIRVSARDLESFLANRRSGGGYGF